MMCIILFYLTFGQVIQLLICKLSNLPSKEEVVDSTLSNLPLIVVTDVFKEAVSNCNLSNLWSKKM